MGTLVHNAGESVEMLCEVRKETRAVVTTRENPTKEPVKHVGLAAALHNRARPRLLYHVEL